MLMLPFEPYYLFLFIKIKLFSLKYALNYMNRMRTCVDTNKIIWIKWTFRYNDHFKHFSIMISYAARTDWLRRLMRSIVLLCFFLHILTLKRSNFFDLETKKAAARCRKLNCGAIAASLRCNLTPVIAVQLLRLSESQLNCGAISAIAVQLLRFSCSSAPVAI